MLVQRSLLAFLTGAQGHGLDRDSSILELFGWPVAGLQPLLGSPGQSVDVVIEEVGGKVASDTPFEPHRLM